MLAEEVIDRPDEESRMHAALGEVIRYFQSRIPEGFIIRINLSAGEGGYHIDLYNDEGVRIPCGTDHFIEKALEKAIELHRGLQSI